ncbi:MAG: TetR/AcrR family transcriptional regulator [Lachnospiraceae bacterium]|nr:TetR/AcrR family transcriptional regulator [Lachnospiraceae bacterium]
MDIRIEKTRRTIINTFLELRSKKTLEKITIKELCEKAAINKSTFYCHYADIYDLADTLESDVVNSVTSNFSHPEFIFSAPKHFVEQLFLSCRSHDRLIKILFSGNRSEQLITKLNTSLKHMVFEVYPEYEKDPVASTILSYAIYGSFYAFSENENFDDTKVIETIATITENVTKLL